MVAAPDGARRAGVAQAVQAPQLNHATSSRVVKGEDVMFIRQLNIQCDPPSMLYMVCDGHSGVDAAQYVVDNFPRHLDPKLPDKMPPIDNKEELEAFAEQLRKALCESFVRLDNEWSKSGHFAGTTVTAVIVAGWLLTVANVGDSSCIVDTGSVILELTKSHRIHDNKEEQSRLRAAGCTLASLGFHLHGPAKPNEPGVGPMRIWPGGLCVSRSIGDLDAGKEVVPVPHIRQLMMPVEGSRLIMASDGLWDALSLGQAVKVGRKYETADAADALMAAVLRDKRVVDDASIIVLDVLPKNVKDFPLAMLRNGWRGPNGQGQGADGRPLPPVKQVSSGGGLFSCFRPKIEAEEVEVLEGRNHKFYTDVDCLKAYPGLRALLARGHKAVGRISGAMQVEAVHVPTNYTMHGGEFFHQAAPQNPAHPDSLLQGTSDPLAADLNKSGGGSVVGDRESLTDVMAVNVEDPTCLQEPQVVPLALDYGSAQLGGLDINDELRTPCHANTTHGGALYSQHMNEIQRQNNAATVALKNRSGSAHQAVPQY